MTVDLATRYLGLELSNPLVVAACPLTGDLNMLTQLEGAGAAAVVMPSLFEEQIERQDKGLWANDRWGDDWAPPRPLLHPSMADYNMGPDGCLRHIEDASKTVSIPVIGSLNGHSPGGWVRFAKLIEQAGASALELNIFLIPTSVDTTSQAVEERYIEIVRDVADSISIPLAVKLGPFFAALPSFARRLVNAGASGLVLFNRYLEPEFDVERFAVDPHLELSTRRELRLPLRWIAILHGQLSASLAATSGIYEVNDVLKALLAGADVAAIASSLLRFGPDHLAMLLVGLKRWLEEHDYSSVEQVRGLMSRRKNRDATAFERANYLQALSSYCEPHD